MRFFWGIRGAAAAVATIAMMWPAFAQDGIRMLDGTLVYRERVALPADALVVVEARDERGRLLGEATFGTRGRQVPLPFEIGVPAGVEADLRVAIVLDGQPRWFATGIAIGAETETGSLGEIVVRRFVPMGFASTLRCGDRELRVGFFRENAVLEIDGERVVLDPVRAASGARFEAPGDPGTWIWSRSNRALVSLGGDLLPECSVVPPEAQRPYTARGTDPEWRLRVEEGRLALSLRDGAETIEALLPEARYMDGAFVYEISGEDLELRMAPGLCRDGVSGMPRPEEVRVDYAGTRYPGCGGDPLEVLSAGEWVVEDIDGEGLIDASRVTLDFRDDGGLGGQASCNRYATGVQIDADGIQVGPIAATQMMCADALMDQERRFFAALSAVERAELDETGALKLYDPGRAEPALTARR